VEGSERDDRVEVRSLRLPRLEVGDDDACLRDVGARDRGELRAQLDRGYLGPALGERPRRLPGAGPDLEDARAERGDLVDQPGGYVGRTRSYRSATRSNVERSESTRAG
jgi:hypothetical protein